MAIGYPGSEMKSFAVHGTLDMKVEGQILHIVGAGPWNSESLQASGVEAQPLVEGLYDKPWAVLAEIRGEPIYVPEASRQLVNIVKSEKLRGRVASALLVNDSTSPNFAKSHIGDIYTRAGETFAFFDDTATARAWLQEQLQQHHAIR